MKKTILFLALSAISIFGFSQTQLLTYKINTEVQLSNGDSIATGVICAFTTHFDNIASTGKIACDISFWVNQDAKTNNLDKIIPCTDVTKRIASRLTSHYISISNPKQTSYDSIESALKTWLESIYGAGKITAL